MNFKRAIKPLALVLGGLFSTSSTGPRAGTDSSRRQRILP